MAAIAFHQSMTTGHGPYPPTQVNASQSKVFAESKAVVINNDLANNHGHTPVGMVIASSSTVFIGGIPAAQVGDSLTDGDTIAQGSSKVFIK